MIMLTHAQFTWILLFFSALWAVIAAAACWVTRAIALDHAADAEFSATEKRLAGRHRIIPNDSGQPLAKPDTIPVAQLKVPVQQPPLRELVRAGRTTDQIEAWKASTDRFIAAMGGRQ